MGFFAGVVEELNRIEDKKERRELFKQKMLEQRKNAVLPVIMERVAKRDAAASAKAGRVMAGTRAGLTQETAALLEATGELEGILEKISKGKPNKAAIEKLNNLTKDVPKERLAKAMNYAFDIGFDKDATTAKYIEVIYAATDEEFLKKATELAGMAQPSSRPNINPYGVRVGAVEEIDTTELNRARTTVERTLAPILGVRYDAQLGMQTENNPEAGVIVNNAMEYYIQRRSDPFVSDDPMGIISEITDKVEAGRQALGTDQADLSGMLDFNMSLPDIANLKPISNEGNGGVVNEGGNEGTSSTQKLMESGAKPDGLSYTPDVIEKYYIQ